MRYLHPVQAHERFIASGCYRFSKDGQELAKTESWVMHLHPDGEKFVRVDHDARDEEGKSILAEALMDCAGELVRLDIRYENARFEGGVKTLQATWQRHNEQLQVGFNMNGAGREYRELDLPADTLVDVPLLIFRGRAVSAIAGQVGSELPIYVPMFEHAQLVPGMVQTIMSPVQYAGDDVLRIGKREVRAQRYRYLDKAAAYWIDEHGVVVKRVNAFKQQEMVVEISNYAQPTS